VELDFLPQPMEFFEGLDEADPIYTDLLAKLEAVGGTVPPSAHPSVKRLHGNDLRGLTYFQYKNYGRSIRIYMHCGKGILMVAHVIENKRRTQLTKGQEKTLARALKKAESAVKNIS